MPRCYWTISPSPNSHKCFYSVYDVCILNAQFVCTNGFYSIPATTKKADAQDSPSCTSAFAYTHSMKLLLHSVYLIVLLSSFYYRRILPVIVHIKPCWRFFWFHTITQHKMFAVQWPLLYVIMVFSICRLDEYLSWSQEANVIVHPYLCSSVSFTIVSSTSHIHSPDFQEIHKTNGDKFWLTG